MAFFMSPLSCLASGPLALTRILFNPIAAQFMLTLGFKLHPMPSIRKMVDGSLQLLITFGEPMHEI